MPGVFVGAAKPDQSRSSAILIWYLARADFTNACWALVPATA
jgi:hypothetical protein